MDKQTAVDSLIKSILPFIDRSKVSDMMLQDIAAEHLAMEEKNMVEFAFNFYYDFSKQSNVPFNLISENKSNAEQYYNETFKSE